MPLRIEPLRSFDSATFTGSYQEIGDPLSNAAVKIVIQNFANQPVTISVDGSTDHAYLDINGVLVVDANSTIPTFASGTQFYVNGYPGDGNEGLIYVSAFYSSLL